LTTIRSHATFDSARKKGRSRVAGDKLVEIEPATPNNPYVYTIAFLTKDGKKRVLLVNKRDRPF
jgi:hypothetical protein